MNALRKNRIRTIIRICSSNRCAMYSNIYFKKLFHDDSKDEDSKRQSATITSTIASKYKVFRDADAPVILDVDEERMKYRETVKNKKEDQREEEFSGLNLERGIRGVYDIEDLVNLLKKERAEDLSVISIPSDINYVDYIVIVTGKSTRHMSALAQFVRKVYKRKKKPSDIIPRIEGEHSKDWMALDLGNIALHIFSRSARPVYDLESLWSLGSQYDATFNKPEDPFIALLQKHSICLGDLQPADRAG
ncbi:hypothetical protein C0J52_13364 [Blattella germanica]|nr:hypothetical protein C0J52_13364 [Blattella germanica]